MKKVIIMALVGLFAVGITGTASAVLLSPGDSGITAVAGVLPLSMTILDSIGTKTWAHGEISGTLIAEVYRDNSDGKLLFLYQVSNDAGNTDGLRALTSTSFKGFTTDVFYTSASVSPGTFDRSAGGTTVGFDFTSDRIYGGEESSILWVKTNAESYGPGEVSIINGGSVNINAFAPKVPEPASAMLLGMGLVGFAGRLIRRKKVVA